SPCPRRAWTAVATSSRSRGMPVRSNPDRAVSGNLRNLLTVPEREHQSTQPEQRCDDRDQRAHQRDQLGEQEEYPGNEECGDQLTALLAGPSAQQLPTQPECDHDPADVERDQVQREEDESQR